MESREEPLGKTDDETKANHIMGVMKRPLSKSKILFKTKYKFGYTVKMYQETVI